MIAEKCKGQSRPQTALPGMGGGTRGTTYNRSTILYSREQFAERIRKAWRDREFSKPNLDIFLANPTSPEGQSSSDTRTRSTRNALTSFNYTAEAFRNERPPISGLLSGNETKTYCACEHEPEARAGPSRPEDITAPYSVFSNKPKFELAESSNTKPADRSSVGNGRNSDCSSFGNGGVGIPNSDGSHLYRWDPELDSNFGSLVNNGESDTDSSDAENDIRRSVPNFLANRKSYSSEDASSPSQSPKKYSSAEKMLGRNAAESSSFESTDDSRTWIRVQDPIPASTRRQHFRNAAQKAIDKSVSAPATPLAATPQPQTQPQTQSQPQTARSRRSNQSPIPKSPATPSAGRNASTPKAKPVNKRLWSVPSSQSFDQPSPPPETIATGYRGYERNIKSAPPPKRKLKAVRRKLHKPFYGGSSASDDDSGKIGGGRRRLTIFNGPKEVETMISLLSPTESETEEVDGGPDPAAALLVGEPSLPPPPPPSQQPNVPPQHFFQSDSTTTIRGGEPKSYREEIREIKPPPMLFLRKSPKPG